MALRKLQIQAVTHRDALHCCIWSRRGKQKSCATVLGDRVLSRREAVPALRADRHTGPSLDTECGDGYGPYALSVGLLRKHFPAGCVNKVDTAAAAPAFVLRVRQISEIACACSGFHGQGCGGTGYLSLWVSVSSHLCGYAKIKGIKSSHI